MAHTIGAAGVGAEIQRIFGDQAVTAGSAVVTLLILVLSEIIPKSLGASYWRVLAPFVAYGISFLMIITYPFVVTFELLSRLITPHDKSRREVTRAELVVVAELGHQEGSLTRKEMRIIKNLFRLKKILVKNVMTPRTVVVALPKNASITEVASSKGLLPFSRIPVYEQDIDNIVGFILRYDLMVAAQGCDADRSLEDLLKPIHSVPSMMSVADAFDEFISRQEHMFAVVDEHGGMAGIITLEDSLETLLGVEIVDEYDSVEDMRKFATEQFAKKRPDFR